MKTLVPAVGGFIGKLTAPGGVIDSVMKVVGPIINMLIPVFGQIIDAVGKTGAKIGELVGILWGDGKGPLAVGVQAMGNILAFTGKIVANLIGFIGEAIGAVINVSKAIMDSPIGWVIKTIAGIIGGVVGGVGGAIGLTPSANAGTGVSANPMDAKYTINIGGKDVDGVVKDSLGRIVTTTTPGR
jgi:phage-related protein